MLNSFLHEFFFLFIYYVALNVSWCTTVRIKNIIIIIARGKIGRRLTYKDSRCCGGILAGEGNRLAIN